MRSPMSAFTPDIKKTYSGTTTQSPYLTGLATPRTTSFEERFTARSSAKPSPVSGARFGDKYLDDKYSAKHTSPSATVNREKTLDVEPRFATSLKYSSPASSVRYEGSSHIEKEVSSRFAHSLGTSPSASVRSKYLEKSTDDTARLSVCEIDSRSAGDTSECASHLAHDDDRRGPTQEHRRTLEAELEKNRRLQAELNAERAKSKDLRDRLSVADQAAQRASPLEQRVAELNGLLESRNNEITALNKKRSQLEEKVLQLQTSGTQRMLEGKLSGVQALLAEKNVEVEQEKANCTAAHLKLEELRDALTQQVAKTDALERQVGQSDAVCKEQKMEIARLQSQLGDMEREMNGQIEKTMELDRELMVSSASQDQVVRNLRGDLQERTKKIGALELERTRLREAIDEHAMEAASLRGQLARMEDALRRAEETAKNAEKAQERLQADLSQKGVLVDGLKTDLARESQKVRGLTDELREAEQQRADLAEKLRDAQNSLSRKEALESSMKVLEGTISRSEQDLEGEMSRHMATKHRVAELEEKLANSHRIQLRSSELEMELGAKQEVIAALKEKEENMLHHIGELQQMVDKEEQRNRELLHDLHEAEKHIEEQQGRITDLEVESVKRSGLEGKVKGLEGMIRQRSAELQDAMARIAQLVERSREQELELDGYARLKAELEDAEEQKHRLEHALQKAESAVLESERAVEKEEQNTFLAKQSVVTYKNQIQELETELHDAKTQLAQKAVVEAQLDELKLQHQHATDRLGDITCQLETVTGRATMLQHEADTLRSRCEELEEKLAKQLEQVQQQQADLGTRAVQIEQLESDVAKLQKENEWRAQQAELSADQCKRLTADLAAKNETITRLEDREKRRSQLVQEQREELGELQEALQLKEGQLQLEAERQTHLEAKILALEEDQGRATMLEGKIAAIEDLQATRSQELAHTQNQLSEARLKLKEAEAEAANVKRLQEYVKTLKQQISTQAETVERLEENEISRNVKLNDLQKELEKERVRTKAFEAEMMEEKQRYVLLEEKCKEFEGEHLKLSQLEGRLAGVESVLKSKQGDLDNALDHNEALQAKVKQLDKALAERGSADERIRILEHEVQTKVEVIHILEGQEARKRETEQMLRAELEAESGKLKLLEEELKTQTEARYEVEARLADVENEAEAKLKEAHTGNMKAQSEIQQLTQALRELEERVQQEQNTNRRQGDKCVVLQDECASVKEALARVEEEKGRIAVELEELAQQYNAEHREKTMLSQSLAECKTRISELERSSKSRESMAITSENKLTTEIRLKDQQMENMSLMLKEIKDELTARNQQLQQRTEELSREQDKLLQAERRYREAQDKAALAQRSLSDAENRIEALRRQQLNMASVKDEVGEVLARKEKELLAIQGTVSALERRVKEEEAKGEAYQNELRAKGDEILRMKRVEGDLQARLACAEKEATKRMALLEAERDALELSTSAIKRELRERSTCDQQKEKNYQKTIAALTQKCSLADDTLSKFEDFSTYNGQLRESNMKLREELDATRLELEITREQVLDLQAQIARVR